MFTIRKFAVALVVACACASQSHAGYLGSNFLVPNQLNLVSDISQANVNPALVGPGSVIFGYQDLGQVQNLTNGVQNLPSGRAWVLFSLTVSSITQLVPSLPGALERVELIPTAPGNALSLQKLVPNLVAQAALSAAANNQLMALEVNAASNQAPAITASGTMLNAMATFNGGGTFTTEFAFGQVPGNGDFLNVTGGLLSPIFSESGAMTVLFNTDGYIGFLPQSILNPATLTVDTTAQVTVTGQVFPPGTGGPVSENGSGATDHATYAFAPIAVPEPSSIILLVIGAPVIIGAARRRLKSQAV